MKFLVIFCGLLAFASASVITTGHHANFKYDGAEHFPVIGKNGVPVDTEEVQKATADHLAYKAEAHARNAGSHADVSNFENVSPNDHHSTATSYLAAVKHQLFSTQNTAAHHEGAAYYSTPVHHQVSHTHSGKFSASGGDHVLVLGPSGVPVDTPAVQKATADHHAHKAYVAQVYTDDYQNDASDVETLGPLHHATSGASHVTPMHYQGHVSHVTPVHHQSTSSHFGQFTEVGDQHVPVIGPNGVPVETPELQQATADHFSHKAYVAQAYTKFGTPSYEETSGASYGTPSYYQGYTSQVTPVHHQVSTSQFGQYTDSTDHHVPVIGENGVPVDTPAVQKATADHLAYKAAAYARNTASQYKTGHHQTYATKTSPMGYHASATYTAPAHYQTASTYVAPGHYQYGQHGGAQHHSFTTSHGAYTPEAYKTTATVPEISVHGTPLETSEVVAAKNVHFAAHKAALTNGVYASAYTVPCADKY